MHSGRRPWPQPAYAWAVVWLLIATFTISYIDRQIVNLVLQPIKLELGISDTKASLLGGPAFVVFYVVMGIPFGWVADNGARKWLIFCGILCWSVATALCGLARSYEMLFIARVCVGIGEATLTPAAFSLIADLFPRERRARPLGLYYLALAIGPGIALLAGGAVLHGFPDGLTLPVAGELSAWRILFLIAALPGFVVLPFFALLREPHRQELAADAAAGGQGGGLGRALAFMFVAHRRAFVSILLGYGATGLNLAVLLVWTPTLLIRSFGWAPTEIGVVLGLVMLLAGAPGIYVGPSMLMALERRGRSDGYLRLPLIFSFPLLVSSCLAPLADAPWLAVAILVPAVFFSFATASLVPGTLQAFTPNRLRGQVSSIFGFVNNIIGLALGPVLVALLTDNLFRDEAALPYSMALVSLFVIPLGAAFFAAGLKPFAAATDAAILRESENKEAPYVQPA